MGTKRYDEVFERGAVRLVREGGRSANAVSKEIGVSQTALSRWLREAEEGASGEGAPSLLEQENAKFKKELRQLRMERDFSRDAAGYFAKLKKSGSPL